jgi:hypothetical protein
LTADQWPPRQWQYLVHHLNQLECVSTVTETHYIDRDFVDDVALFYSRSLRGYPNHCARTHFFSRLITAADWHSVVCGNGSDGKSAELQEAYLGFLVRRPLPGSPIGRTVLRPPRATQPRAEFGGCREYVAHLAGTDLRLEALAFQQQDQGVSACATTALWSSLHKIADGESIRIPTPAAITQAASRYYLPSGRALPSEGLTLGQMSEACRAFDLSPIVTRATDLDTVRGIICTLLRSGFPPVLAIKPVGKLDGHAVCAVGWDQVDPQPHSDPTSHVRDGASRIVRLRIHDDRLGPYALADLESVSRDGKTQVQVTIRDLKDVIFERAGLEAVLAPLPSKLRLSPARMRDLGFAFAQALGNGPLSKLAGRLVLDCRYAAAIDYVRHFAASGVSARGISVLRCQTTLSRYVGLIEISADGTALFDILLDATETEANPAILACVQRCVLDETPQRWAIQLASAMGVRLIR